MKSSVAQSYQIVIIEDNQFIRKSWELVLGKDPDFDISGSFHNCESALNSETPAVADMLLLNIKIPGLSAINFIKYLKKTNPGLVLVVSISHEDDPDIVRAICAGAAGFLTYNSTANKFLKSLKKIMLGESMIAPNLARKILSRIESNSSGAEILTAADISLLKNAAQGKSILSISEIMHKSNTDISQQIYQIYKKLSQQNNAQ